MGGGGDGVTGGGEGIDGGDARGEAAARAPFVVKLIATRPSVTTLTMIVAEEPTTGGAVKPGRITTVVKVAGATGSGGGGGDSMKSIFKNTPTAAPAKPHISMFQFGVVPGSPIYPI
jgi:hypothetical protein